MKDVRSKEDVEALDIGQEVVVHERYGGSSRMKVLVTDSGNLRLKLQGDSDPAADPQWYGYDRIANAWRPLITNYAESLSFDASKPECTIEADRPKIVKISARPPSREYFFSEGPH